MNIAKLLKYCPINTKLYSTIYGEVEFVIVNERNLITIKPKNMPLVDLYSDGRLSSEGECTLFPSKDQRDWNKFRLPVKKGDIMMSDGRAFIISDDYADTVMGAYHEYICGIDTMGEFKVSQSNHHHWTNSFYIPASEEAKKELFDKMKEAGYKWNADTLKLEKIEPEFKDGDVYINKEGDLYLLVDKIAKDIGKAAILYPEGKFIAEAAIALPVEVEGLVLATPSDRNKLFSFLVRKGYKYDKEQHKLIKQEFKPFDKVLVRDDINENWTISLFSHYVENGKEYPFICMGIHYRYCIPYEGNEYLLGTTNSLT